MGYTKSFAALPATRLFRGAEPEKRSLEVALSLTRITSDQLCYVGRDTAALVEANAAGFRTVAVNYDDDAEADIYLGHFEQLLESLPWKAARTMVG
jgi:phosphoglycolate phosphatase-like HAD superfamily hydrolase